MDQRQHSTQQRGERSTETAACILIVEDQPSVRACLEQILTMSGYLVLGANDGHEALVVLRSQNVDLILADIVMPNMDGYQLYEQVARNPEWVGIPFIYLTARSLDNDIRYGKGLGVDDYLVKPVEAKDLLATVSGKLRRARLVARSWARSESDLRSGRADLVLGRLRIEPGEYRAWLDGERVKLSNTEFKLLECMAQHANRVVPTQDLVETTHGLETTYADASDLLRPMIRSLRRKLGYSAGDMGCIESVRGVGYRLIQPANAAHTQDPDA
jgi:two-component system alkaline phosphatase synthesis response regulator PhoP